MKVRAVTTGAMLLARHPPALFQWLDGDGRVVIDPRADLEAHGAGAAFDVTAEINGEAQAKLMPASRRDEPCYILRRVRGREPGPVAVDAWL